MMEDKAKDMIEQIEDKKEINSETTVSRRQFFKKTIYAAPSLVVLGSLARPTVAYGSDTRAGPGGGFGGRYGGGNGNRYGGG